MPTFGHHRVLAEEHPREMLVPNKLTGQTNLRRLHVSPSQSHMSPAERARHGGTHPAKAALDWDISAAL